MAHIGTFWENYFTVKTGEARFFVRYLAHQIGLGAASAAVCPGEIVLIKADLARKTISLRQKIRRIPGRRSALYE